MGQAPHSMHHLRTILGSWVSPFFSRDLGVELRSPGIRDKPLSPGEPPRQPTDVMFIRLLFVVG